MKFFNRKGKDQEEPKPVPPTIRDILSSPDNCRGHEFDPNGDYKLVTPSHLYKYRSEGYRVVRDDVFGANGEQFALIYREGDPNAAETGASAGQDTSP
jgi:hypothetical protein